MENQPRSNNQHHLSSRAYQQNHPTTTHLHATRVAHRLGAEVGVGTRAVPVALDGLGCKGDGDAVLLPQAVQQPARQHH